MLQDNSARILLLVSGMSPQIVTETLYALTQQLPTFVPTQIHLITTATGAEQARLNLLEGPCHFARFCTDYGIDERIFVASNIHIITDAYGNTLSDIRTPAENEATADFITEKMLNFTADDSTTLHVSIAGGRKTMGYYAGYALSLFGRPQDRLSHVLVSEGYEGLPDFYYPTPRPHTIYNRDKKALDAAKATVSLAQIPFVRLRAGRPERLLEGSHSFSETIAQSQLAQEPPQLIIDKKRLLITCNEKHVHLPPVKFAFYAWLAGRDAPLLGRELLDEVFHKAYADEFCHFYRQLVGEGNYKDNVLDALSQGMHKSYVDSAIGSIKQKLRGELGGPLAEHYLIKNISKIKGDARYTLTLDAEQIHWES